MNPSLPLPAAVDEPVAARAAWTWLDGLLVLLLVGNLCLGRSFAHFGVAPLFVGEVSLGLFLLARWRSLLAVWVASLMRPERLTTVVWLLTLGGTYGLVQCWRGFDAGYDRTVALQDLLLHGYPLFLFLGLSVGVRHRDLLVKLVLPVAWIHGLYGVLYMAVLHPARNPEPLALGETSLVGDPVGSAVLLLGLLSLEPRRGRVWAPFLLNLAVLVSLQVRAEMLGLAVALVLWGLVTGRLLALGGVVLAGASVLFAAAAADVRINSPGTRGGEISARTLVGKLLAPIAPEMAKEFKRDADIDAETVSWRTGWWRELWRMVHQSPEWTLFGPGYGYPIWDLHPEGIPDIKLRTPHNVFMFALSYTGWVGVVLFIALQIALGRLLWQVYRVTGQPFGLCLWVMLVLKASFENFFEAPFNAIPFYLLVGLALAPLFHAAPPEQPPSQDTREYACENA
jgi:hypothetical protein